MRHLAISLSLLLAGCSEPALLSGVVKKEVAPAEFFPAADAVAEDAAAAEPQIAYRYTRSYRAETDGITDLQARHIAACEALGTTGCQIIEQRLADSREGQASVLLLSVNAKRARALLADLDKLVEASGGQISERAINAENLGTRIVDTEARLRAKQALADRLLAIIRNRSGSIKDVVAAEQAFAEAQGDLESARAELALMRRQVARSEISLSYRAPAGIWNAFNQALRPALDESGMLFSVSLAMLLRFVVAVVPWLLALGLPLWLLLRRRRARKAASDKPPHDTSAA
jgi:glycine cleavage system regulatory protein